MLRHRSGLVVVAALAILVAASGVVALTTGDARLSMAFVYARFPGEPDDVAPDLLAMVVLVGLVRVWGLWQILPKRHDAGRRPGRDERLLRIALYAWLAFEFVDRLSLESDAAQDLAQVAATVLFFRVMRPVSLPLRVVALVAGLLMPVRRLAVAALEVAGADGRALDDVLPASGVPWLLWLVLTLVAQAKDGRWRRGTLWAGAVFAAGPVLGPEFSPFSRSYVWFEGLGLVLDVIMMVWLGRSAREVAGEPGAPSVSPPRCALRWWPAQGAAVVVPLVPAVVNGVNGVFAWIGPRGAIVSWFSGNGWFLRQLWLPLDLLIGIGGASGLVLAAVLLRTRRLVLGTSAALLLAAAAGVVSGMTTWNEGTRAAQAFEAALWDAIFPGTGHRDAVAGDVSLYGSGPSLVGSRHGRGPTTFDELLASEPGISPLWYSAAFTASALLLTLAYATRPARRGPYRVAAASLATGALLALVPASDQEPDRTSTYGECESELSRGSSTGMTGERAFVCGVRYSTAPLFGADMPDRRVIAYGRRMCGVYTSGDPRDRARFRQAYGIDPLEHAGLLASICPKAEADVEQAAAEEEAEMLAWEAEEQAMCDRAPRHRPLVEPVRATRRKEPVWPEIGLEAYEDADVPESGLYGRDVDLVATAPGHLLIEVDTTYGVCVTTETYDRRPPVETKGWQHVVEVGYESPTGVIELTDNLAGVELPDLSLRGRKGHYRIRVHYDPPDWERKVGQRLLVMAWPGRGDDRVVHRAPQR